MPLSVDLGGETPQADSYLRRTFLGGEQVDTHSFELTLLVGAYQRPFLHLITGAFALESKPTHIMTTSIHFFPVGNGDMTLIELESDKTLLIDINIRAAADDADDDTPDVATQLRDRLKRDADGRLYVDAFLLSHPDQDHCTGLKKHFHLGDPSDWSKAKDKILIRELWSSPMAFRRASRNHTLCDDAKAFNKEARRRVKRFQEGLGTADGNRILILGRDEDGKTDDLEDLLVEVGDQFSQLNGTQDGSFSARLLGPQPPAENEDEEGSP